MKNCSTDCQCVRLWYALSFRFVFLLFALLLTLGTLPAQPINNAINDVAMAPPNAAAMNKYIDMPVSTFTGVPNVSIPIYNIQEGPITVPISLSYHASGVKLAETASWVGLGWSLSAGGSVTRSVIGFPDDEASGTGYIHNDYDFTSQIGVVSNVGLDTEPDAFYYNFGGYSGKMMYSRSRNNGQGGWFIYPKSNLQVEVFYQGYVISGMEFTTPEGLKYLFGMGEVEKSQVSRRQQPAFVDPEVVNVFNLKKITGPNGIYYVEFAYEAEDYEYTFLSSNVETTVFNSDPSGTCASAAASVVENIYSRNYGRRLTSITTSTNKVVVNFIAGEGRSDLDVLDFGPDGHAKRLDRIEIQAQGSSQFCKAFHFKHSYADAGGNESAAKRLILDELQESYCGAGNESGPIPPYIFSYKGDWSNLPSRLSKQIDHWGYYNGATANENLFTLIPYTAYIIDPTSGDRVYYKNGDPTLAANRSSNESTMLLGSLEQITYPTGGTVQLIMGANEEFALTDETSKVVDNVFYNCGTPPDPTSIGAPINLTTEQIAGGHFKAWVDLSRQHIGGTTCSPCSLMTRFRATIKAVTTDGSPALTSFAQITIEDGSDCIRHTLGQFPLTDFSPALSPGRDYIFEADFLEGDGLIDFEVHTGTYANKEIGGLRIEQLIQDPEIGPEIITDYVYQEVDPESGSPISTGVTLIEPKYGGYLASAYQGGLGQVTLMHFSSIPLLNTSTFNGHTIGYRSVYKITGGQKSRYEYQAQKVSPPANTYPIPPLPPKYKTGELLQEEHFNSQSEVIASTINQGIETTSIEYSQDLGLKFYFINCSTGEPAFGMGTSGTGIFIPAYYNLPSPALYRVYDVTETVDGVTKHTNYEFNSIYHVYPTEMSLVNSDNKTHTTEYIYPPDYTGKPTAKASLLAKNMISTPIETRRKVDGQLVGGDINTFKDFHGTFTLPYQLWEIYEDSEERVLATLDFHNDGRLKSLDQLGKPLEEYAWENQLLKTKSILDWTWTYHYYPGSKLLSSIVDLNDIESTFTYDPLMRLINATERNGGIEQQIGYDFTLAGGGLPNRICNYDVALKQWSYQYFDGLGRDLQSVRKQYSPNRRDVVDAGWYDSYGRPYLQYLPYEAGGDGSYADPRGPYTRFSFEDNPLSRETRRTFADNSFSTTSYGSNGAGEVNGYAANELYKQTVTDENGHPTETFTDKIGQLILTRRYVDGGGLVDTYQSYDDRGNLVGVMPPETSSSDDPAAYKYVYNNYNLLEEKKVPGAGVQTFTYDNLDRLSTSTDAESNTLSYTYDNYSRQKTVSLGSTLMIDNTYDQGSGAVKGKLTKELVANLDGGNGTLPTTYQYDDLGRLTSRKVGNHQSGVDGFNSHYYGATDIVQSQSTIHNGYIKIRERYTYDHAFRRKETWHKVNLDPWVLLSDQGYNHRDELIGKGIGGEHGQFLQSIGYGYNVRGWLTGINLLPLSKEDPVIAFDGACIGDNVLVDSNGECGLEINLEQLFDLRMLDNINLNCFDPCEGEGPILTGAGGLLMGNESDLATQQAALAPITEMMSSMTAASLTYPTSLYRVHLLGDSKLLLEEEMNLLEGDYVVDQCQELTGPEQSIGVILTNGTTTQKTVGQLLELRQQQTPTFTIPTCNPSCALSCNEQEQLAQTESLLAVNTVVMNASVTSTNFPVNLLYVELCNGEKRYLLEPEAALLAGSYAVLQRITVFNAGQVLDIVDDLVGARSVTLAVILEHRKNGIHFLVDGFGCDVTENATIYPNCDYQVYHENWSYTNVSNSRQVEVKYDQVVTRDCGSGPVELRRKSITELLNSSKQNTLVIGGGTPFVTNGTYLDRLYVRTANPDSLLAIVLNPHEVFTEYPDLAGQFPASDLIYSVGGAGGINADFNAAIKRTIEHAITEWSAASGPSLLTYQVGVQSSYTNNNGGIIRISFSNWHEPTSPYVNLEDGVSYATLYPQGDNGSLVPTYVLETNDAGSDRTFSDENYTTPCGLLDVVYQDEISDPTVITWRTIPINSPDPQIVNGGLPNLQSCSNVGLVDNMSSSCTQPLFIHNGSHLEVCGTNGPIFPIPGDSTYCPVTSTFSPSYAYGSEYYLSGYPYASYDLPGYYPGVASSFTTDQQVWLLPSIEAGEAAWNIGLPRYLLELDPITAFEVEIDIPFFEANPGGFAHFALWFGGSALTINGGQDKVYLTAPGVITIQPDLLPTIDQLEQLELVMYGESPGSIGIESIKIQLTNNPCGLDDPPTELCEVMEQIEALSVEENEAFANALNQTVADLRDYHVFHGHSLFDEDTPWSLNNFSITDYTLASCSWDVGRPFLDTSGIIVTEWSATIQVQDWFIENNLAVKAGLAINDALVPLDNGTTSIVINQAGDYILTPATLPTMQAIENLEVVLLVDLTNFVGSPAEQFSIDAVWADFVYTGECSPCYVPTPNCSPSDMLNQYNSLQLIEQMMLQIANIGSGNPILTDNNGQGIVLSFPLNLHRVRLCNGDIIYLLDHELTFLEGDYYVEQVMVLTGWEEIFEIRSDPGAGNGSGASGEPALEVPDLFAMEFHYQDENQPLDAPSQYNGNIAWTKWQVKGRPANYYGYRYDEIDRLKKATFAEDILQQGMVVSNKYTVDSPEQYIKYDKRGNIQLLRRNGGIGSCELNGSGGFGWGMVDQLDYRYNAANQLDTLLDANDQDGGIRYQQSSMEYDDNGNLIKDTGKEISMIEYNHLNLPKKVTFTQGTVEGTIEWSYDAKGVKQVKKVNGTTVKEYLPSGVEYDGDKIEAIYHAEGRIIPMYNPEIPTLIDSFRYEWVIRDHLGNGRVYFGDLDEDAKVDVGGAESEIMQEEHYYPFGLNHQGPFYPTRPVQNNYQYNNKELNEEFGLNWLDYGARFYSPALGRFPGVDPLADHPRLNSWSPYTYTFDNPIIYTDPDGRSPIRGAIAAYRYAKRAYKIYKKVTKAGEKFTSKHLKDAGIDEIADMAGDLATVFGADVSGWDRAKAAVDLIVGTDFNGKGTKAVDKVMDKTKNGKKGVYYNEHESGKSYVGKGGKGRQKESAKEKSNGGDSYNEEKSSYHGSKSNRDAQEEEAIGIRENFNTSGQENTYNKIINGRSKVNETFGGGKYNPKKDYK